MIDLHFWNPKLHQDCRVDAVSIDSREISHPHTLFIALQGEKTDGHHYVEEAIRRGAVGAIVREDFPHKEGVFLIRVKDPLIALQELAHSHRIRLGTRVIGIAGMFGKTMLKELLGQVLTKTQSAYVSPGSYNSQIGVPLSLLRIKPEHTLALIEMGASEPGELQRLGQIIRPNHVIITKITRRYLNGLCDEEKIAAEVDALLSQVEEDNWRLVPGHKLLQKHPSHLEWDTPSPELPHAEQQSPQGVAPLKYTVKFPHFPVVTGQAHRCFHYIVDLLNMFVKGAALCGVPEEVIYNHLNQFSPEPLRTEIWKSPEGVLYVNEPPSADKKFSLEMVRRWAPGGKHYLIEGEDPRHEFQSLQQKIHPGDAMIIRAPTKMYPSDLPINRCVINLAAIRENLTTLQRKCGKQTRLMVMVKAFAYGLDDLQIARFLNGIGIGILGVSNMDEAIALRRAGVTEPIFVIHVPPFEIQKAIDGDVEIGLSDPETLQTIEKLHPKKPLKVHLHVDTGMKRFGVPCEKAVELALQVAKSPAVQFEGIMTHLACADNPKEDPFTNAQIAAFDQVIRSLQERGIDPPWKHAANSAGVLRFDWPQYNMARIGLAVYGLHSNKATQTLPLRLAVSLQSRITALNVCHQGESVSYGRQYKAARENEIIAIVPIGYYDGLHRHYSGKGYVLIQGKKAPLVGSICMDFMMVNVTEIPDVTVGDAVLIFGEDDHGHFIPPEDVALTGNSITHELISCLGPRIQRFFIIEEAQYSAQQGAIT